MIVNKSERRRPAIFQQNKPAGGGACVARVFHPQEQGPPAAWMIQGFSLGFLKCREEKIASSYLGSHWDPRGAIWAAPQYLRSNNFISFHHPSNMSSSQRYTAKNMQITVRSHNYMIIMGVLQLEAPRSADKSSRKQQFKSSCCQNMSLQTIMTSARLRKGQGYGNIREGE